MCEIDHICSINAYFDLLDKEGEKKKGKIKK